MKNYFLITVFFISLNTFGQLSFENHINSIKQVEFLTNDKDGKIYNTNERSVQYAIEYLEKNGIKTKYITNRKLLKEIENIECKDSLYTHFYDVLKNNTEISVKVKFNKFTNKNHVISEKDNITYVDNQIAFGSYYNTPTLEIDCLKITVNNKKINIPKAAYKNFYDVTQCSSYLLYKPVKVYTSENGDYIFIYLYGGNAANTYFAKLIFNKGEYITQIVADYKELVDWRVTINKNFIGF
ncbi:hypothetical protein [Aquimarina sp. RZ0]|uniref:hypothetical protein n=1 Tax=Aquimarina sp. RZ0 TaxID=2607730 RepID=UPI0011F1A354|nr:hypothetical protein [Aquimarina sp. RZ0]KAA1242352.1 hypothetical protein F0000_25985 [Aquimarina sp. RZ0]